MSPLSRTRPDGCLSDLALDRLVRDELDAAAATAARAHAAGCAACGARLAEVEAERARFRAAPPPLRLPTPRRRHRWRALASAGAGLAAAAALILFWRGGDDGTRPKGGSSVAFYVQHAGQQRRVQSGDRVAPGDFLQLTYSGPAPLYGAILSVDGAHHVSRYFPDEPHARSLPAGAAQRFPRSTELDDVLGHEQIYALLCHEPLALPPLEQALAADRPLDVPDCYLERLELDKRPP